MIGKSKRCQRPLGVPPCTTGRRYVTVHYVCPSLSLCVTCAVIQRSKGHMLLQSLDTRFIYLFKIHRAIWPLTCIENIQMMNNHHHQSRKRTSAVMEICQKLLTTCARLSRSLEVSGTDIGNIRTDTDRPMTSY